MCVCMYTHTYTHTHTHTHAHTHTHTHTYISDEAYAQLRTREQLGYIVAAEVVSTWGVTGLRLAVQSARSPDAVHSIYIYIYV
jgi:secreted Zn-dependent insulinase-like peptidase